MKALSIAVFVSAGLVACSQQSNFKGGAKQGALPPAAAPTATPGDAKSGNPAPEVDTPELFKDCNASQSSKFVAKLYQIPEGTNRLPDFPSLSPLREVCLKQLDITKRRFEDGFPGVDNLIEWFALDIYFDVKIEKDGDYAFRLHSDDGSRLIIDGKTVIDNDGQHDATSKDATVRLTAGQHKLNVQYFQGPRFNIALELFWKPTGGGGESYLPLEMVSRP